MTSRPHRIARWALLACLVVVLIITFWPTPVDRPFYSQLVQVLSDLHRAGMPAWVNYGFVEFASNVIMFVPFGALIALYSLPSLWWASGVLGLALSLSIELCQYLFLPERLASAGDLAANTAGALIGGGIVALIQARADARASRTRRAAAGD